MYECVSALACVCYMMVRGQLWKAYSIPSYLLLLRQGLSLSLPLIVFQLVSLDSIGFTGSQSHAFGWVLEILNAEKALLLFSHLLSSPKQFLYVIFV